MEPKRLDGIGRLQELCVEGAFLFVELGNRPLQRLDFLAHVTFVLLRKT